MDVQTKLDQYTASRVVAGGSHAAVASVLSVSDDVLMAIGVGKGHATQLLGGVTVCVWAVECAWRYRQLCNKEISPKVFKIQCAGATGAAVGGFAGAVGGTKAGALMGAVAGPTGAAVGGILGGICGAAVGSIGGRVAVNAGAVRYFGDEDTEVLVEMVMESMARMELLRRGITPRKLTTSDVSSKFRELSRGKHPDKLVKLSSQTDAEFEQNKQDANEHFGLLCNDAFLVGEWVKARQENTDIWTTSVLDQMDKKIEAYRAEQKKTRDAMRSTKDQMKVEMNEGRKIA